MTKQDITTKTRKIIAAVLKKEPEQIGVKDNLKRDLDADSLDRVEIILAVEDEFGLEIDEDQVTADTVDQIVDLINARLNPYQGPTYSV